MRLELTDQSVQVDGRLCKRVLKFDGRFDDKYEIVSLFAFPFSFPS